MMKIAQFMFSIVYVWAQPRDFHLTPKLFIMPRSEASSESSSSDERTEEVAIAKTENITIDKKTKEERIDEKREVKTKEKVNRVKGDKDGKDDKSKSKMRRSDDKKRRGDDKKDKKYDNDNRRLPVPELSASTSSAICAAHLAAEATL